MEHDNIDLISIYTDWYKKKTTLKELKSAQQIITPFLNHLNDRIAIFVEILPDNTLKLSDDGVTLNELNLMGINIETPGRQRILQSTLKNFNIKIENEIMFTQVENIHQFPQAKHNLLQSILRLNDLMFTDSHKNKSLFTEEVLDFFFENNFGGNEEPKFSGASGIIHSFDYDLGGTKHRPTTLIKFQNKPSFADVASQKFVYEDLSATFKRTKLKFVFVTGEKLTSDKILQALPALNINLQVIHYKDQSALLELR